MHLSLHLHLIYTCTIVNKSWLFQVKVGRHQGADKHALETKIQQLYGSGDSQQDECAVPGHVNMLTQSKNLIHSNFVLQIQYSRSSQSLVKFGTKWERYLFINEPLLKRKQYWYNNISLSCIRWYILLHRINFWISVGSNIMPNFCRWICSLSSCQILLNV